MSKLGGSLRHIRAILFTRSIRFKLAATFVAIFGITLIAFSAFLYEAFLSSQQKDFDAALFNHAVDVAQALDVDVFGDLSIDSNVLATRSKIFPFSLGRSFVQVRSPDGIVVGKSVNLGRFQLPINNDDVRVMSMHGAAFRTITSRGLPRPSQGEEVGSTYRMVLYRVERVGVPRYCLQIAVPLLPLEREAEGILSFLLINVPLTLIIALLGALYFSRRALKPISAMIESTNRISAKELSARLPLPGPKDEVRALAGTINDLLERLQLAFESQEKFVADASHQLKTPLAILRGEIDLMRTKERSPEELREFLASASQEIDHLTKMVQDLLLLARMDAGVTALAFKKTRLDEILIDVIARLEPLAQAKRVRLLFNMTEAKPQSDQSEFELTGDPDLLRALFHNLIENAIKYTSPMTTVRIDLEELRTDWSVRVQDQGPGVPVQEREQIFRRFFRVSQAREVASGAGLGLPIARRIAEAHRGSLQFVDSSGPGALFVALLPKG